MTGSSQKNRVIFLDFMRAFAVMMMVQGHTIDAVLGENYRNLDNPVFWVWTFMRGMTAPIFLMTSGTVFMYLFRTADKPFRDNPRVAKGFQRVVLLIMLGYLLRYPDYNIFYLGTATYQQWVTFFSVDVLHLIGFGLLFTMLLGWLAELLKKDDFWVFLIASVVFVLLWQPFEHIDWKSFISPLFSGYLYTKTGSLFPLFPWLAYFFLGAIIGSILAKYPMIFKDSKFSTQVSLLGIAMIVISVAGDFLERWVTGTSTYWTTSPNLVIMRVGFVLLLMGSFIFASLKVNTIPKIFILLGRNTLLIYVVHLLIMYQSPAKVYFTRTYTPFETLLMAVGMISLMVLMVYLLNFFKLKNNPLVAN